MEELNCIDCTLVKKFSLEDQVFDAKVIKVYDGDTVTVVFKFNGEYYKWLCRLDGIDTPELKTSIKEEKQEAVKARDFLIEKIFNKIVQIHCGDFDKYGRLLCKIFYENVNINELMIQDGYAVAYFGGTKNIWHQ